MQRFLTSSLFFVMFVAACAHGTATDQVDPGRGGGTPVGAGGNGGGGGGGGATAGTGGQTGSTSAGGGTAPTTCAQANGYVGCCEGDVAYFCAKNSTTVSQHACPSGQTCGWNTSKSYYSCVNPPGGVDPSHKNPIACQ